MVSRLGLTLCQNDFDEFYLLVTEIITHDNFKKFDDDFFIGSLGFLSKCVHFNGINKILSKLVELSGIGGQGA